MRQTKETPSNIGDGHICAAEADLPKQADGFILAVETKTKSRNRMTRDRYIYVLDHNGNPLMPCRWSRARKLLRDGKAVVVRKDIYTIRLTVPSSGYRQECSMGIDLGSCHVGVSVTTDRRELLSSEVLLRDDISRRLTKRRGLRTNRRFRKTRYRAARFDNRTASKKEGWLAPSVRHKVDSIRTISLKVAGLLPIKKVTLEGGRFDAQAIINPEIQGTDYQNGPQRGFDNVKAYVKWRDGFACQQCGSRDHLEVHHIRHRSNGGSDRPANLITLCHDCHRKHHEEGMELNVEVPSSMKDLSAMNTIRKRIILEMRKCFPVVKETWGFVTSRERHELGITKSHVNDAYVISGNYAAEQLGYSHLWRQKERHSRKLHEEVPHKGGKRKSKVAAKWIVAKKTGMRFRRFDRVAYNGNEGFVAGSTGGQLILRDIRWTLLSGIKTSITPNKVSLVSRQRGGFIIEKVNKNNARSLFEN